MEGHEPAACCPGDHGLVSEQLSFPTLHGASESYPSSDLVTTGAGFGVDLVVRVSGQTRKVASDQVLEKIFIERDIDLTMLGFAGPMRQTASGDHGNSLLAFFQDFPEKLAQRKTPFRRRHRRRQGVDDDRYDGHGQFGIKEMQWQKSRVIEQQLVGKRWIESTVETGIDKFLS